MIPFTRPYLPALDDYSKYLQEIWDKAWITNQGPLLSELEDKMAAYLGVKHISFVSSGTMGLQLALRALRALERKGEVITSPYSYVATTSAISWEGFKPVFVDVNPHDLNINASLISERITKATVAVMATHVYGNPCDLEALQSICSERNIALIYDGAHAFGSKYNGGSVLSYGDFSVLSTHATKLFHTANGGFVISKTAEGKQKIDRLKNFGHEGQNNFVGIGINGKNSELHAALGLSLLKVADELIEKRQSQWQFYSENLERMPFTQIKLRDPKGFNGSYFPIICQSSEELHLLLQKGEDHGVELRRYFSPSLNTLSYVEYTSCHISEEISKKTLCLPMYHDMTEEEQLRVINILK